MRPFFSWPCLYLLLMPTCFLWKDLGAQPVLPSKMEVAGLTVYKDLLKSNIYYYAPGKLRLATDKTGKPGFQLVQMRYTGTGASGNQGEKRFLNLVQLTIWMDQPDGSQLQAVQNQLGGFKINLKPLPLQNMEAFLVMPVGDGGGKVQRVGKAGGMEGANAKGGYWTEKVFTVRLDNHEAQLLWDQLDKGRLAMSLSYAFFTEAVSSLPGSYDISGDPEMAAELKEELDELVQLDSTSSIQAFEAGAFSIDIDPKLWPDVMRKVDINEDTPPAWAILELRCYDFSNALRPDLGMKMVEIEASGVTDEPVKITGKRFMASTPDQNTLQIKFPYAIKMTKPYRYRIIEYTEEGQKKEFPWVFRENWSELLDVTTPPEQNNLLVRELEIELPQELSQNDEIQQIQTIFLFVQKGMSKSLQLNWPQGAPTSLQTLRFYADREQPVHYYCKWKSGETWKRTAKRTVGIDDYIYLNLSTD